MLTTPRLQPVAAAVCSALKWHLWGCRAASVRLALTSDLSGSLWLLQLLNILFCTLMFSGGLPLLLPCVSIIFGVTYWAEKWELLKLSRVPSPYAADLATLTGKT